MIESEVRRMAAKKSTEIQKRMAMLEAVFYAGYKTEKAVTDMTIEQILNIKDLTVDEMRMLSELQKAVKNHKVISFLSGGDENE
jgi:hypothetical protein